MLNIYNSEHVKIAHKTKRDQRSENAILLKLLLIIIILAPLPFGCNRPWSWSLLCLLTALMSSTWSIKLLNNKNSFKTLHSLKWPIILYCLTLIWVLIQLIPPLTAAMSHPIWPLAGNALQTQLTGSISTSPYETVTAFMRLLSYGLIFLMASYYCRDIQQARMVFKWISIAGLCYACYGLIIFFGDYKMILWYDKWAYQNDLTSTFVNRNSYATYAGLGILCSIPLLYEKIKISTHYGLKTNFGRQYFIEQLIKQGWFIVTTLIALITALFLTHSRGGFLSTLVGLTGLFVVLSLFKKSKHSTFTYSTAGLLFLLIILFEISGDKLMLRFIEQDMLEDGRQGIFDAIITGINTNPWYGMGYGTFEQSFRLYRNETMPLHIQAGHNTYLENIFELGLPQALLLFSAIALVAVQCLKGVRVKQRNVLYPAVGFSATVLVASHSFTDFSLQMPAIAATYAAIMGAAFAQSFSHR